MGQNALDIVRAPATLSRSEQLLTLGLSGVALGAVAALDRPVYRGLSKQPGWAADATRPVAGPGRWFDRVGPDRAAYATAGLLATSGLVLGRRDLTRTSVRVVEALLLTKAVTGVAKGVFNRSRPFVGEGPLEADPGGFDSAHAELSMPSGHTARAFALASVLAHQADRWYVSALAYGGAASVGMERIRSGDHWLTDVAVGGALGYLIGRSVVPAPSSGDNRVAYTPILSADRIGLSIRF
jgi:membrane-associated phospholipid phosphatase